MIPDFKTFIKESIWADIHKRSNGEQIRKEDDINILDGKGIADYINDHYEFTYDSKANFVPDTNVLIVPIMYIGNWVTCHIFYNYAFNRISISSNINIHTLKILKLKYKISKLGDNFLSIYPKDGSKENNSFFIDIIDYLIDNEDTIKKKNTEDQKVTYYIKKKDINESVWADIHKRSNGEQERKEDIININAMDPTEFYKYLIDTYETKDVPNFLYGIKMSSTFKYIDVPVLQCPDEDSIIYSIDYEYFRDNKKLTMGYFAEKYFPELFAKMKEVYDVKTVTHAEAIYNKKTTIKPLDGSECTNSFFINVIEFILKNSPKERIILSHK